MKIEGFDELNQQLEQLQKVADDLDGLELNLSIDTEDPSSIQNAIREMESAIDTKVARYSSNELVRNLGEELKEKYRAELLAMAESPNPKAD